MYLIWKIEAESNFALPIWQCLQKYLCDKLQYLGADAKAIDAARILRIVNTVNSKSNTYVKVIKDNRMYFNQCYLLKKLQAQYLPELTTEIALSLKAQKENNYVEKVSATRGRPRQVVAYHRELFLYQSRLLDLCKLIDLRQGQCKGHREIMLFLYRYWSCCFTADTEQALEDVLALNEQFNEKLKKSEVVSATRSAEVAYKTTNKEYRYTNSKLIKLLQITQQEQEQLLTIISTKEIKRRKSIRNKQYHLENRERILENKKQSYENKLRNNGKKTKNENNEELRKKISDLQSQGHSLKDIAKLLDISYKTAKRLK